MIWYAEEPFADRAREFNSPERRADRARFEAAIARDPEWAAARQTQQELAEHRGGFAAVHNFAEVRSYDPDGRPVYRDDWNKIHEWQEERRAAVMMGMLPVATWGPSSTRPGSMSPANDLAVQIEEHTRQKLAAAELRQMVENQHRGA